MTKTQLLDYLAESAAATRKTAALFLDALVELTYKEAKKTGEFTIPGLGKLVKVKRKARMGRNPFTGQALKIAAKTGLKFRVSKTAKDAVLGAKKEAASAPKGKAPKAAKPKGR